VTRMVRRPRRLISCTGTARPGPRGPALR
jgi:hypothetical protein